MADAIIVTGASRGIGKAIALQLAKDGFAIAINYVQNEESAQQVADEIKKNGGEAIIIQADVSKFEDAQKLVAQTKEAFGNVYGLINNAGITRDGLVMRMSQEDCDAVIETNLTGALYCTRHASAVMLKQKRGRIVNISSVAGVMGNAGQANYSAAKAGMIGLTKAVARELAPRNITANAVAPGLIQTDMIEAMPQEAREKLVAQIPMKRAGTAQDVANLVSFLCSDKAGYITGQAICIDGALAT